MKKVKQKIKRNETSNAITLIALVITIIILLILAGVAIAEFTISGLFAQSQKAELETKRSTITEWLDIKLIEEQTNNPLGTAEEIIEATRENVIQHQEELLEIGKEVEIEEIKDEENGEKTEVYFYVIVDEDVYKVELEGVKFIGKKDEFPPIIKITEVTNTTSTITVTVETQRNEGGKIEYWIKSEDEEEYIKKGETEGEEKSYKYEGLTQNKKYNIKVIAIAKNKKTAEATADEITGSVPDLTDADITFTYSIDGEEINRETWTNKNITATASTTVTGYTLQTSKDGKTWTSTANQTFTANGTIYARLYDGTNYGGTASGNVTNIDTTKPVVTSATATTNTITIKATDEASGIIGYAVTTTNTAPTSFTSCTSTKSLSTTVSGKTQGTTYYVWVKDAAGNVSASKSTATGTVTDLTTSNVTFTYSPAQGTWTNGSVTATASTTVTGYTLQTSKDGTTWTSTASQTFTANGTIYARLYDGTNYGGTASGNVTNIDTTKPTIVSATGTTATGNTGTITVTSVADTGGSGLKGYYISTSSTAPTATSVTWTSSTASSFKKAVSSNGTYYIWVIDNAGNVSASKSCKVSGIVSKASITSYSGITILSGNTGTPTLTYTGTPKSITYSSSNTGVATINSSTGLVTGVSEGTATMTVKLTNYDGTTVSKTCTVTVKTLTYTGNTSKYGQVLSTSYSNGQVSFNWKNASVTIPGFTSVLIGKFSIAPSRGAQSFYIAGSSTPIVLYIDTEGNVYIKNTGSQSYSLYSYSSIGTTYSYYASL